jgi:hypothetical protein
MDHLDPSGHREHATQPAEGLRDAVGFAEGTNEIDIRVQQRPHPLDVLGLPRILMNSRMEGRATCFMSTRAIDTESVTT